ncbi:hypothetical protein CDD83_5067 [Cordyceps sp. RAO-2017]|nr:hypothetical protein CDD83_5067 [Cordyceps sp. RAO-2017]
MRPVATTSKARLPRDLSSDSHDFMLPLAASACGLPPLSKGLKPLGAKIATILSTTYSDDEFRDTLSLLNDQCFANDARTRRQFRLEVLKQVLQNNGAIVDEFQSVAEQLQRMRFTLDEMTAAYEDMKLQVLSSQSETLSTLAETSSLLEKRCEIKTHIQVLNMITDHFTMSDDEKGALINNSNPVDERYFEALRRMKGISQDCKILLGFEGQTLGSDLIDQMSQNTNLGFQKLYRWVHKELKALDFENPQMNPPIRRALRVLAERPSLLQNSLDVFVGTRDRILCDAFEFALTGNKRPGDVRTPVKPIDLAAHDTFRYVSDIFAWVHSAAVSEREVFEVLFFAEGQGPGNGTDLVGDRQIGNLTADEDGSFRFGPPGAIGDLVDRDLSSVSRVLGQRVQQAIHSVEEPVTAYRLAMLISFYCATFRSIFGASSQFVDCVNKLEHEALRQFRALIRDQIVAVQTQLKHTQGELLPPVFLHDALSQLKAILQIYSSSISASGHGERDFAVIICEAYQPFMTVCEDMATSMNPPDDAIFLLNCRLAAAKVLEAFDFARHEEKLVREKADAGAAKLIAYQQGFFRTASGLQRFLTSHSHLLSDVKTDAGRAALQRASQQLDDFLPSALIDAMERLKGLQDLALAREITEAAATNFCTEFETLEVTLKASDNALGQNPEHLLRSIFPRTTAEIRVLLF